MSDACRQPFPDMDFQYRWNWFLADGLFGTWYKVKVMSYIRVLHAASEAFPSQLDAFICRLRKKKYPQWMRKGSVD